MLMQFVCPTNKHPIRVAGLELVCLFIDDLHTEHEINGELLAAALPFSPFLDLVFVFCCRFLFHSMI